MLDRIVRALLLLLVTLAVGACQAIEPLPDELHLAGTPLVTVEMSGGRCVEGTCAAWSSLDLSGRMVHFDGTETTIPPERVARIAELIAAADWPSLAAVPFEGECPTAFDGPELTWTIHTPGGPLELADCTIAVDYAAEPFRSLREEFFITGG